MTMKTENQHRADAQSIPIGPNRDPTSEATGCGPGACLRSILEFLLHRHFLNNLGYPPTLPIATTQIYMYSAQAAQPVVGPPHRNYNLAAIIIFNLPSPFIILLSTTTMSDQLEDIEIRLSKARDAYFSREKTPITKLAAEFQVSYQCL